MHLGRLLDHALLRFNARVLALMAEHEHLPLRWAHRIEHSRITAAQVHLTRHLGPQGARLSELAALARMSKQAMANLVDECEVLGLVAREPDAQDARAKRIAFTEAGRLWHAVYQEAVQVAEAEFKTEVGAEVATVVALGLEAYAGGFMAAQMEAPVKRPKI
jgi:DNA-binding MarR family transcriptional regulator